MGELIVELMNVLFCVLVLVDVFTHYACLDRCILKGCTREM